MTVAGETGPRATSGIAYIPALDGIRGVAIIVIMGYHGGVFFTSGGFYSLDTFFALSGFLITTLLVSEHQRTGAIRLSRFWVRRARRLLPGLLLMLLGVALFAAFLVSAGTYPTLRGDGLASLFYVANWHFIATGSNYFDQTALTSPLTHMWSLAVEEQFYLVWPLVVLGLFSLTRSRRLLLAVCVVGALASALEMALLYSVANVNRIYYGTDTRAQSLLVGAALAVGLSLWADRRSSEQEDGTTWELHTSRSRRLALLIGLGGVAGSLILWITVSYNDAFAYRGGFLLAALATSGVLFSVVTVQRSILARALTWTPLRYVGRISYGMYLWHFPLFTYLDGARVHVTGYPLFFVRVAATLVIATASYYLVELPIRRGNLFSRRSLQVLSPVAVSVTALALVLGTIGPSAAPTLAPNQATKPAGPPVKVLVVGDSTALTLDIGLNEFASDYGVEPYNGGILGCGVTSGAEFQLKGVDAPMAAECSGSPPGFQWNKLWAYRISVFRPNVVMILVGRWETVNRTYRGHWTNILHPSYAAYVKSQLVRAVHVAGSGGAQVVLLTAPCYDSGEQPNGAPWPEDAPKRLAIFNNLVRQVAAQVPGTSLLNFNALACPGGHYEQDMDGQQVRESDGVHFTFDGGNVFASRLWPKMVALGRRQMARAAASTS
ncbi:MAG TPA: acyltransferase family protein [Acidimicrobiales bacterium]|jgi:peptidoglycan/LPS O-acetylase OafA/YrhL